MMKSCLIIAGGEYAPIKNNKYDLIIACDKGYSYAKRMKIIPDIIIGDFDSYAGKPDENIKTIKLPEIKDDTDTMYAVKYALQNNCDEITICCALGGRLDHSYANIQSAAYILMHKGIPCITGKDSCLYMIKDSSISLPEEKCSYISVFSYSEKCSGVTLRGLQYELDNAELDNSFPLGVSNEWKDKTAFIEVRKGTLLIITSKKTM